MVRRQCHRLLPPLQVLISPPAAPGSVIRIDDTRIRSHRNRQDANSVFTILPCREGREVAALRRERIAAHAVPSGRSATWNPSEAHLTTHARRAFCSAHAIPGGAITLRRECTVLVSILGLLLCGKGGLRPFSSSWFGPWVGLVLVGVTVAPVFPWFHRWLSA